MRHADGPPRQGIIIRSPSRTDTSLTHVAHRRHRIRETESARTAEPTYGRDVATDQPITIRPETRADRDEIAEVIERAFGSPDEARLVDAIRASDDYIAELALVATLQDTVVGQVMISKCAVVGDDTTTPAVMLSPLAVDPEHQRAGIGALLVRTVADRAADLGHPFVVLEGDPRYYSRFGFEPAARFGVKLPLPDWAPPEAAQLLRLHANASIPSGRAVYPDSFAVLDD